MYLDLDANQYLAGSLLAEAETLLDKAEQECLVACGTAVPLVNEKTGEVSERLKALTETDRTIRLAADVAAFRRFRNELRVIDECIRNRLFNLKGIFRFDGPS